MKYLLSMPIFSKKLELEINEEEYYALKDAKEFLHYIVSQEEIYDIVISNYVEFEKEILHLTLENMMYSDSTYDSFYQLRMHLNQRLLNLLSSVKSYQEIVLHLIPKQIKNRKNIQENIKSFFSEEYDNNKHYKFLEELRKYTQHAGLPIHLTRLNSSRKSSNEDFLLEYSINFASYYDRLKTDKMFNSTKFPEIEDEIDLKTAVRYYIEAISAVHDSVRKLFKDDTTKFRSKIEGTHKKFKQEFDCRTDYIAAYSIDDDQIKEKLALLLDWDNTRIELKRKNRKLTNLSKRYITNITKTVNPKK